MTKRLFKGAFFIVLLPLIFAGWILPAGGEGISLPSFADLAEKLSPSVVSVQIRVKRDTLADPYYQFFKYFMGEDLPPRQGAGSGFIISEDGYLLTNNHVIEDANDIEVFLMDNERGYRAKIVGRDEKTDIGLLKIEPRNSEKFPVAPMGDSEKLRVGDWVMAIGNPLGKLSHSVAVGVVSAKGRREVNPGGVVGFYADFIQTDAAINFGNSGGPLINTNGEVIGINTAIMSPMQTQGIGFAIPINMVKELLPQLKEKGRVERSWLGVVIQPVTPEMAEAKGLERGKGALVVDIAPDGPAQKAGIKKDDIVIEFDGKRINTSDDLRWFASMAGVGRKVPVKVLREKSEKNFTIQLSPMPQENVISFLEEKSAPPGSEAEGKIGIMVAEPDETVRGKTGVGQGGVYVIEVSPLGPAAEAGVMAEDLILKINGHNIKNLTDFKKSLSKVKRGGLIRLFIQRGKNTRLFVVFRKP